MNLLEKIVDRKRNEVAKQQLEVPLESLEARLDGASKPRGFADALAKPGLRLIAEVKKASPSVGLIRDDFDPVAIATSYEQNGAACLSVLTDEVGFQGTLEHLIAVREAVSIPILRKDFILDHYQVVEARAAGADCILLIAECLDQPTLKTLFESATSLGMDVLIELYEPQNLARVLEVGPRLVGINNRDLRTFETRLEHTLDLLEQIPDGVTLISESGIKTKDDIDRLRDAGVGGVLIGETLMRSEVPGDAITELGLNQ
jgi:indole-3-glycerol phosphate synthase